MDPNELLKNLLEAQKYLKALLETHDPEAALLDALNSEMVEGETTLQEHLSTLVSGFDDLDDWIKRGGFLPGAWADKQKQETFPNTLKVAVNPQFIEDLQEIMFPGGNRDHEWDSDTTMELGNLMEEYKLVPPEEEE